MFPETTIMAFSVCNTDILAASVFFSGPGFLQGSQRQRDAEERQNESQSDKRRRKRRREERSQRGNRPGSYF
jgi:hypothetical protein